MKRRALFVSLVSALVLFLIVLVLVLNNIPSTGVSASGPHSSDAARPGAWIPPGQIDQKATPTPFPLEMPRLVSPANGATFGTATVDLRWTAVSGATSYNVRVKKNSTSGPIVFFDGPITNKVTTSAIKRRVVTNCYWQVQVCNDGGCGDWTMPRTFTLNP